MPFPPTFDNVWDITQPPDTQLANLLGQDIRNLKDDVMQRFSLLSGVFANRPTPETVNATWGGAGFGILYFSTDTKQIFQWSGAAWVDVSSSFVSFGGVKFENVSNASQNVFGDSGIVSIFNFVIPANELVANQVMSFKLFCRMNAPAVGETAIIQFFVDGILYSSAFAGYSAGGNPSEIELNYNLFCVTGGAGGSFNLFGSLIGIDANSGGGVLNPSYTIGQALDFTASRVVDVNITLASGNHANQLIFYSALTERHG